MSRPCYSYLFNHSSDDADDDNNNNNFEEKLVNNEQSHLWLESGDIKGKTESRVMTAKDQATN